MGKQIPYPHEATVRRRTAAIRCCDALAELHRVRRELAELPPARVIWSFEDRTQRPPGNDIAGDIDSLATYFVTSHGRDLISLLAEVFEALQEGEDTSARIVDY
jgi:hypothetical protein